MSRELLSWSIVLLLAACAVAAVHYSRGTTTSVFYYDVTKYHSSGGRDVVRVPQDLVAKMRTEAQTRPAATVPTASPSVAVHFVRSIGIWVSGFFVLAVLSFLYRDNPFYKIAENVFVGVTTGYYVVQGFWKGIVPELLSSLYPKAMKFSLNPGLNLDEVMSDRMQNPYLSSVIDYTPFAGDGISAPAWIMMDYFAWVPAILGVMLLWQMAPKGGWIARWPLAFVMGTFAGIRLMGYVGADFIDQVQAAIQPLIVPVYTLNAQGVGVLDLGQSFYQSFSSCVLFFGMLCALLYFFFSVEHKGVVGVASRIGIWVLMITFGGGFGYTVMGRITLLTSQVNFVLGEWLNVLTK